MRAVAGRRSWRVIVVLVLLVGLCGTGTVLYFDERNTRQETRELSVPTVPDWVELDLTTQEVDVETQQLTLYLTAVPHGGLAQSRPRSSR
ncbi:hypothetical protein ACFZB9_08605 [Kitasatospora sp. NPDC008050]|uniref:hypothetical protein n=1 Tax=Kitasatospora sp. NPDC008050 TaxID=3364021 RepID=UPI0036E9F20C